MLKNTLVKFALSNNLFQQIHPLNSLKGNAVIIAGFFRPGLTMPFCYDDSAGIYA
jgi:hypothetical protein